MITNKMRVVPNFSRFFDLMQNECFSEIVKKDVFECLVEKTRVMYWNYLKAISRKEEMVKEVNGYKMMLPFSDPGISREIMIDGVKEVHATREMYHFVDEGDVVFDIGANIGYYCLLESMIVGNKGKIFAVEPVPSNVEMLKKNLLLNVCDNVEVYQIAMGNKKGVQHLFLSSASNQGSMLEKKKDSSVGVIDVEAMTVDEFLKDRVCPDMIRMDVEGFESNVLKGAEETLKDPKLSKLFVEVHCPLMGETDTVYLFNCLKEHGFEISAMYEDFGYLWVVRDRLLHRLNKDYSSFTIQDVLDDSDFINGSKGFEIFFKR